jgi:hypothetical protein
MKFLQELAAQPSDTARAAAIDLLRQRAQDGDRSVATKEAARQTVETLSRLHGEKRAIRLNSNTNLALGVTVTVAGLYLLSRFVFSEQPPAISDAVGFLKHYVYGYR